MSFTYDIVFFLAFLDILKANNAYPFMIGRPNDRIKAVLINMLKSLIWIYPGILNMYEEQHRPMNIIRIRGHLKTLLEYPFSYTPHALYIGHLTKTFVHLTMNFPNISYNLRKLCLRTMENITRNVDKHLTNEMNNDLFAHLKIQCSILESDIDMDALGDAARKMNISTSIVKDDNTLFANPLF